jgi:hypothetical protein
MACAGAVRKRRAKEPKRDYTLSVRVDPSERAMLEWLVDHHRQGSPAALIRLLLALEYERVSVKGKSTKQG